MQTTWHKLDQIEKMEQIERIKDIISFSNKMCIPLNGFPFSFLMSHQGRPHDTL